METLNDETTIQTAARTGAYATAAQGGGGSLAERVKKFTEALRTKRCSCGATPTLARSRGGQIRVSCDGCDLQRRIGISQRKRLRTQIERMKKERF